MAAAILVFCTMAAALCLGGCDPASDEDAGPLTVPHVAMPAGWERVPVSAGFSRALKEGVLPLSRRYAILPIALGLDGRTLFATLHSSAWSGVVRIDTRTDSFTRIKAFDNPAMDQAGGDFDGRWLVWTEWNTPWDLSDFVIWSWDSRSGQVRKLGRAIPDGQGRFWDSSWEDVVAMEGVAAWEQGSGRDDRGQVHAYDLSAGHDRIVRQGHPGEALLLSGRRVIWTESMQRGALTIVRAADAVTGDLVQTPPALAGLRGPVGLVTDGRSIAFTMGFWRSIWWSDSPDDAPRQLFRATPDGYYFSNPLAVSGRYLYFQVQPRSYLADIDTKRVVELPGGGWMIMNDSALVITTPSEVKKSHAVTDVIFLPMSTVSDLLP